MRTLLEHAEAQVHLDARRDGVMLPERLRASGNVRLDYGYELTPPIHDLNIDENGISATLAFNRVPCSTFVPWSAVFLIADFAGRGAVWREDLPAELMIDPAIISEGMPEEGAPQDAATGPAPKAQPAVRATERNLAPPAPAPRRFTILDGLDAADQLATAPGPTDETRGEPDPPRPRPALRLVK